MNMYLAVLEGIQLWERRWTVNLVVGRVPRHTDRRLDAEHVPAIAVRHREVLPDRVPDAVDRPLQKPLAWPRWIGCLHDYVRHLVSLQNRTHHTAADTQSWHDTPNGRWIVNILHIRLRLRCTDTRSYPWPIAIPSTSTSPATNATLEKRKWFRVRRPTTHVPSIFNMVRGFQRCRQITGDRSLRAAAP